MALPETNLTLIARMKDPVDERSCQEFVGAWEPFLQRMLIRRGLMDADARDLSQQVFQAVCRSLNTTKNTTKWTCYFC
jgi:DNA-directed RNA polymerase specialized sigma24 family protein